MPKINRIRIANVPYNGKYIVDQTIDTFSGENVLLNLANGCGKSVITQMMMQPIVPTTKIHKRKVESYLTSKEPTFIMIEWILDNTQKPTYFLTGIVMNKTTTEDNDYRIKYFTFVNEYQTADNFDIKNIDFISQDNNITTYKSYDYCLKELRSNESNNSKIQVFSRDEQKLYNEVLEQNGIFKDEWKILANINEKEGGIDDIFSKCEKSDDVINTWILKRISDSLDNEEKLRQMFFSLMTDILEHEDVIKQKEELEKFKIEAEEYVNNLNELLKNIDEETKQKNNLEEIYLKLQKCIIEKKKKEEEQTQKISDLGMELKNIDYEEISEQYYSTNSNLEAATEEKELNEKKKIDNEKYLEDLKLKKRKLEAAKIYAEINTINAKLQAAFIDMENLNNSDKKQYINQLKYTLKIEYKKLIEKLEKELEKIKTELNKNSEEIENLNDSLSANSNNRMNVNSKIEVIKSKKEDFKKEEEKIFKELDIHLTRNILEELEQKEIQGLTKKIETINKELQEKIKCLESQNKEIEIKLVSNEKEIENKEKIIEKCGKDLANITTELESYQIKEDNLKAALNKSAILEERIFDRETNLVELARQKESVQNRYNENITILNKKQEILDGIRKDGIHIDLEIANILNKNNIDFETGETYLKAQSKDYQNELLNKNPMLPYCYIVAKKDIEKIEKVLNSYVYRLTPIMCYEDIKKDFRANNNFISITDNVKLACLYNKKAFDAQLKTAFENEIVEEIENLKNKIVADNNKIIELENTIKLVDEFKFTSNYKQMLEEKIKTLKEELDNEKAKKIEIKEENKKLGEEEKSIFIEISNIEKDITENSQKNEKFQNYLIKNDKYIEYIKLETENNKKFKELIKEKEEISNMINNVSVKNEDLKNAIKFKQSLIDETKNKSMNIFIEDENIEIIADKTLEELEKIYQEMTSQESKTVNSIREKINNLNENKIAKEKSLDKKYSDLEGSYTEIEYNEEAEDTISDEIKASENEQKYLNDKDMDSSLKVERLKANIENIKEQLSKMNKEEPLQAYLIKGNYKERRKNLDNQIRDLQNYRNLLTAEISEIDKCGNSLLRVIEIPKFREVNLVQFDYKTLNTEDLIKEYRLKKNENDANRANLDNLRNCIYNKFIGENQVINNFLNNMNPYQNAEENKKFADYYFTYERVTGCLETMEKLISALENEIANVEKDKENVKYHAFMQAKTIYTEMKKISDSSTMKISGKLRKVPILEIGIPKELDQYAKERMDSYIEECINNLREKCKNIESTKKIGTDYINEKEDIRLTIEKEIDKDLSDRILLNKIINSETITLKLYKIDISESHSGLRSWEEVIVENSGGEKMISCLILVLALMQYSREKILEKYGDSERIETSKILILDNPFGKMSSNHLLDGLMEILGRFNVQVICLSDISQSSITNHFKVIYQMSLKSGKYTDKSYLTVDNVIKSEDSTQNYLLEHAYFKGNDQIKMW